jgi:hypothetical protein
VRPRTSELDEGAQHFLKLLFERGEPLTLEMIASCLRIPIGIVEYHRDKLSDLKMVTTGRFSDGYELMPDGREYVVKRLLKK